MSDIVERLRDASLDPDDPRFGCLYEEAVDEIERLRDVLQKISWIVSAQRAHDDVASDNGSLRERILKRMDGGK